MKMVGDRLLEQKAKVELEAGDRGYYPHLLKSLQVGAFVDVPEVQADCISKAMTQLRRTKNLLFKRKQLKELGRLTGFIRVTRTQ